jgi:type II secretory pathway component GspD/PulD (secretin)
MLRTIQKWCRDAAVAVLTSLLIISSVALASEQDISSAEPKVPGTARQALRTPVTYSCVDKPIENVLMELAEQANIDIIKSPKVDGNVTAKVTNVPLEEALTNILAAHDYTYVATESMIRVVPIPQMAVLRERLVNRIYQVTFADSNEVAAALRGFISDRGRIALNRGTSHILVTDTESNIKAIDRFIEQIDLVTPQVLVEVRIYEITSNEGFELGTEWSAGRNEPEILGYHEEVDSRRSGYDFDQLLPHMGDLLPRTEMTTTQTGDVVSTNATRTGDVVSTNVTRTGDVDTTTVTGPSTTHSYETTWGNYRDADDYLDPRDDEARMETEGWTENPEITENERVVTGDITETETTRTRPTTETETIRTGPTTETTTSGIRGFDRYYDQLENSAFSKKTETKRYITRRRRPFVGGSFDRVQRGSLSFSLLNDTVDLELALHALHQQVEAKLLANPRVLVLDNETANFEIVREFPYRELRQVAREDPITYTEFKDVGINLKVTPHITRQQMIKLHITPEFSVLVSLDPAGVPTVDARRADTVALIRDGQTIAMGGLRKRETAKNISKVPILGDLPLLGGLFRSESESVQINELVVFITTQIVTEPVLSPAERQQFSQTEFAGPKTTELRLERPRKQETEPAGETVPKALEVLLQELDSFERQSLKQNNQPLQ